MNITRRTLSTIPRRISYGLPELRGDVVGGITAGIMALPVSLSYGVLSGLGPAAGVYGAITVGLFGAVFGGTRGMISGVNSLVAITMAVVVTEYTTTLAEAFTVAMLAGLIQILFGVLRLGRYIAYIPSSLTTGFFSGIGVVIVVTQCLPALGLPRAKGGLIGAVKTLPDAVTNVNVDALAITALCFAIAALWRGPLQRVVPAHLIMVVAGTLVGALWFRDAPVVGDLSLDIGLSSLNLPIISAGFLLQALQPAFILALLSCLTSMMATLLLESVTGLRSRPNQTLISQGIGNTVAGLVGALPGGVGSGSLVNVRSGARSGVSGIVVILLLLLAIFGLETLIERIPTAVLAVILITVCWTIIDWRFIFRVHRIPVGYVAVMALTAFMVMFVDFVGAVLIGIVVSALIGAQRSENAEVRRLVSIPVLDQTVLSEDDAGGAIDPFEARSGLVRLPYQMSVASAR